jgi:hypothetical protein
MRFGQRIRRTLAQASVFTGLCATAACGGRASTPVPEMASGTSAGTSAESTISGSTTGASSGGSTVVGSGASGGSAVGDEGANGLGLDAGDGGFDGGSDTSTSGEAGSTSSGTMNGGGSIEGGAADAGMQACGAAAQPCCAGQTCTGSLACVGGTCDNGIGAACSSNADCSSGLCEGLGYGFASVCTTACTTTSDCVSGWVCGGDLGLPGNVCKCTPSTEGCAGKDNDCDGVVDEQPAADEWCETQTAGYVCLNGSCTCGSACGSSTCIDTSKDPNNCGGCGVQCTGTCTLGRCLTVLATGTDAANGIAVDGDYVYWSDFDDGQIRKVSVGGGDWAILVPGQNGPGTVAVDAANVYWTNQAGEVMKVAKDGTGLRTLATDADLVGNVLATDGVGVYWAEYDNAKGVGKIMRVPAAGGTPAQVVTTQYPTSVAVDTMNVYWATSTLPGSTAGSINSIGSDGGNAAVLASGSFAADSLAVEGTTLYWAGFVTSVADGVTSTGGAVTKVSMVSGIENTLASQPRRGVTAMSVDDSSIYWLTEVPSGSVMKTPLSGGPSEPLAPGQARNATAMVVDATSVYWINVVNDVVSIMKLTPK